LIDKLGSNFSLFLNISSEWCPTG